MIHDLRTQMVHRAAPVIFAILLSLSLRCWFVFRYAGFGHVTEGIGADAGDYLAIAFSLSKTGVYGHIQGVDVKSQMLRKQTSGLVTAPSDPDAWRPPLWPMLLSVIMRVSAYDLRTMFLLRFLIDGFTVAVFYRLLLYLDLTDLGRLIALVLFALHPAWLLYSATLLSEPFTMLIHIALAGVLLGLASGSARVLRLAVAGLLSGLTVLVHPYYLLLPVALLLMFSLAGLITGRDAGTVLLLAGVVVAPWVIRNMTVFHTAKPVLTTSSGRILARGWNPNFLNEYRNTTGDLARVEPSRDLTNLNQLQSSDAYLASALKFVKGNWRLVPAIITRKVTGALLPFPETPKAGLLETGRTTFQFLSFCALLVMLGVRRGGLPGRLAAAEYIAYLAMAVATVPTIRYRFPLIWIELICVVAASEACLREVRRRLRPHGRTGGRPLPACTSGS